MSRLGELVTSAARLCRTTLANFIANGALSRGAAISFYAVTSLAPVLLIVVSIAGLAFGQDIVRERLVTEVGSTIGPGGADLVRSMLANTSDPAKSLTTTIIGFITVLLTASGVFGEIQAGLNATWNTSVASQTWLSLFRSRLASLGLVATLGFLLVVSLAVSAALTAVGTHFTSYLSATPLLLSTINGLISVLLFALLFAAIYRTLPDVPIDWRDVVIGALVTSLLFTIGKSLIGWYLGAAAPGSAYGAAAAPVLIMLWIYYSSQILLLGAEITKLVADRRSAAAEQRRRGSLRDI